MKSFKKCCIFKSDVDMLWIGCEDEGTECEDGDSDTDW